MDVREACVWAGDYFLMNVHLKIVNLLINKLKSFCFYVVLAGPVYARCTAFSRFNTLTGRKGMYLGLGEGFLKVG